MESFYDSDKIRLVMIGTNALEIQRRKIYQVYTIMSELSSKNETVLLRNHKRCTMLFFAEVGETLYEILLPILFFITNKIV